MYEHIPTSVLLWALGMVHDAPAVAEQCAFALRSVNRPMVAGSEALVLLHDPDGVAGFMRVRLCELGLAHGALVRREGDAVCVRLPHDHGCLGWPARMVRRKYSLETARQKLELLLHAKGADDVLACFGAAVHSPFLQGDVLVTLESPVGATWYGPDPKTPKPGDEWFIDKSWPKVCHLKRQRDGARALLSVSELLDRRVWNFAEGKEPT